MKNKGLSEKQRHILEILIDRSNQHAVMPSFREFLDLTDLKSTSGISHHLEQLESRGYITRRKNRTRAIRVLKNSDGTPFALSTLNISVPITHMLGAGDVSNPSEGIEFDESILINTEGLRVQASDLFAAIVRGNSMADAMVADGDLLLLRKSQAEQLQDGTLMAVRVNDSYYLKYFHRDETSGFLRSANPETHKDIPISPEDDFDVLGYPVKIVRNFAN